MPTRKQPVPAAAPQPPNVHHAYHAHHMHHAHYAPHRPLDLDAGDAFVPDYRKGFVMLPDADAEALGEEFIASATSAEPVAESARDEVINDELAGLSVEELEEEDEE